MAVDVLIAEAVRVVNTGKDGFAILLSPVESEAVFCHAAYGRAVCIHRVLHTKLCCAAGCPGVAMRACAALCLAVAPTILGIEQVGYPVVHQTVYLLHSPLYAVVVEVRPRHTCCRTAACDTGSQLVTHDAAAYHAAQVGSLLHPFGFHVLYPRAVAQHNHVELCRFLDGEIQGRGIGWNIGYKIHAGLELRAERADDYRIYDVASRVREHTAHQIRAGYTREADTTETGNIHSAHGIATVRRI